MPCVCTGVWVNYRSTIAAGHTGPYAQYINRGGERTPCQLSTLRWVEVMHMPSLTTSVWGDQFWLYVARGSGLWYNAGRTLVCSDSIDLAAFMNYSGYKRRDGATKPPLFEEARRRFSGWLDSISFTSHGAHNPMRTCSPLNPISTVYIQSA